MLASVSSLGRFRNVHGVVSTPSPSADGYVRVAIHNKDYYIHRLIIEAFNLPREEGETTVDHINNNPSDNHLSNLRWASPSEQITHSYATNAERKSSAHKRSKPVLGRLVGTTDEWTPYASTADAARTLGVHVGSVSNCCNGKKQRVGAFTFKYDAPTEPDVLDGEVWRDVVLSSLSE